jgi:SAM-dependent methyltransferase
MFHVEAARICEILLERGDVSPLLNLGSSTREFREVAKPHIGARLFAPLRAAGVAVVHSDMKTGEGVDVVGDISDPTVRARLKAMEFRCVLISNVLEHVRDRAAVIAACEEIAGPGGLILATVPESFPFHADPIDTGYRPTPAELGAAFTGSRPLIAETLEGRTYAGQLAARGASVWAEFGRTLLWTLAFPVRPNSARARLSRWRWLNRRYRVSIALVEVRPS